VANLLVGCVVAPIMEEIVFRWITFRKFAGYGPKAYVFFSALCFALFHANPYQTLYAFALGALFAAVVWYTGRIRYTIILHVAVNLIGLGMGMFVQPIAQRAQEDVASVNPQELALMGLIVLGVLVVAVSGLIFDIAWYVSRGRYYLKEQAGLGSVGARQAALNVGMVLFIIVSLLIAGINIGAFNPSALG